MGYDSYHENLERAEAEGEGTGLTRTEQTMSERELHELLGFEDDEVVGDREETHSGAWIKENHVWRWYQADNVE